MKYGLTCPCNLVTIGTIKIELSDKCNERAKFVLLSLKRVGGWCEPIRQIQMNHSRAVSLKGPLFGGK